MDKHLVFRRTPKGQDEIKTRQLKLEHNHRFALIMIDGTSDVAQLEAKSGGRWDTHTLLQDLWQQGLIEPANVVPASTETADAAPTSTRAQQVGSRKADAASSTGEESLKERMIAQVRAVMGDTGGEKLIAKIQASEETPTALADAVDSGCIFIKLTISEDKAETLKKSLHAILAEKFG